MKKLILAALIMLAVYAAIRTLDRSPLVPAAQNEGSRLSGLLGSGDNQGFEKAIKTRTFQFPEDHGPHSAYRNEWWYLTGNLDDEKDQRFGFELTFFRFALGPEQLESKSGWRTNQVYIAHFAITDQENKRFYVEQRYSRGALGLAGAQSTPFKVWIDDWSVAEKSNSLNRSSEKEMEDWHLTARAESFSLDLNLVATKRPVLNGIDGLSQKSAREGNASYYYSITRMQSSGNLKVDGQAHKVNGDAWLDREWGSSALSPDQQGWDWFALQLSDGSELMFYSLRKNDGSQDEHSAGTWVSDDGLARHLSLEEVSLEVTGEWESPEGGIYPSGWTITIPALDVVLEVVPILADQELFTTVRYWEGAVDVVGIKSDVAIDGRGYVELTGYGR